jgi:hypothetical protein
MTGRERLLAAFGPQGTRTPGAVICYEGIFVRDHATAVSPKPWWYRQSPNLEHQLAWYEGYLAQPLSDWYQVLACAPRAERERQAIEEGPDGVFLQDLNSGFRQRLEPPSVAGQEQYEQSYSQGLDASKPLFPDSAGAIEAAIPQPSTGGTRLAEGERDLADLLREGPAAGLLPMTQVATPLWHCLSRWNTEDTLMRCLTDPDLVLAACDRLVPAIASGVRRAAALGAEAVWIEECLTDLISPALFARLNAPYVREVTRAIREAGMKSVYYYCGNPMDRLDQLLECGADALSFEESKKTFRIEIAEVAARVNGRCVLLGNLDSIAILQDGSESQLRREIARQLEAGQRNGGRFIMSLGSPVTPATPLERVRLYHRLATNAGPAA